MITGRQIREGRKLLELDVPALAGMTNVPVDVIERAESVEGTPSITLDQGLKIQAAMEKAGVRFGTNGAVMRSTPRE